jgi:hypothetical protein
MIYYLLLALIVTLYIFLTFKRAKKYKYDQSNDYVYSLNKNLLLQAKLTDNTVLLTNNTEDYDTLFLKIDISYNPLSYFFKPTIEIENVKHYFEYGAKGIRYLNISHVKDKTLKLKMKHLILSDTDISIYGYKNDMNMSDKILILAPHADDAEIAAFGLYKTAQNVTIVTTTAGEHGHCNYCDIYDNNRTKNSLKKGELRVLDALTVPLLGNVDIRDSLTLGYFGGSLKWMSENHDKKASSLVSGINDINLFRKVSHANIKLPSHVEPLHSSFTNDLKEIIEQIKPTIIITPHPSIDSHPDHKYTTITLSHALQETNHNCKLFLYTNHLELSETYPIGKMNSAVTLPPSKKKFYFDSLYSFGLDKDLQIDKFFALESIHDLRDSLVFISIKKSLKHLNKMIKREVTGKDKSYYKRAVRANELYFVVESENIDKLMDI